MFETDNFVEKDDNRFNYIVNEYMFSTLRSTNLTKKTQKSTFSDIEFSEIYKKNYFKRFKTLNMFIDLKMYHMYQ